jgi:glycosyltransferase involved in cell wall biosynthesis
MRIALIGPTYPYRGGITHHTTLLARALRTAGHELLFVSFSRQYPRLLYGRSDKDPSQSPLTTEAHYWLDSINPLSWLRTAQKIRAWQPELVVMPWWVPFWSPAWGTISRWLKRGEQAPTVVFLCHNVLPHERSRLDVAAVRWALSAGDGFVVHAQPQANILQTLFPDCPVAVTPHPTYADLSHTAVSLPTTIPTDRPLLLFCGLVRPYKGLDILLEATAQVLTQRPVHLAVVGEFWEDTAVYQPALDRLSDQRDSGQRICAQ